MSEQLLYVLIFAGASIAGVRGSLRLTRRYRKASENGAMTDSERLLLGSLVVTAWIVTIAALYLGFLSVRRMLGYDALPALAPVSFLISVAVLVIPTGLDFVIDKIAKWGVG